MTDDRRTHCLPVVATGHIKSEPTKKRDAEGLASRFVPNILQLVRVYVGAPCFGGGKWCSDPVTEYVVP
jgi:hypothetical protein